MMMLWMFFLILLAAVFVWFVVRERALRPGAHPSEETPLDIIRKRYARGEISKEEFERMKNDLRS